jgi:hypothetical protein
MRNEIPQLRGPVKYLPSEIRSPFQQGFEEMERSEFNREAMSFALRQRRCGELNFNLNF